MGWLILLFTIPFCPEATAQRNPQPHFRNYSTEHGLPSPEVYCAFQDSRGYLWFGTDNGAARFDGYDFRTYGALDGLTSNVVFDIYEDTKGRIWFGTMTGETFLLERDSIVPYPYNHLVLRHRKHFDAVKLAYLDPDDETAYFELNELGMMRIDSSGRDSLLTSESPFARMIVDLEGVPQPLFTTVYRRSEQEKVNQYYEVYEVARKLVRFEMQSRTGHSLIDLPITKDRRNTIRNVLVRQLSSGQLLIHCNQYLYCLNEERLSWAIPYGFSVEFKINEIREAEDGAILFCMSEGGGLRKYQNVEALRTGVFDSYLDGLSVSDVFRDNAGGLWVSTQEQGVFYCSNRGLQIYDTRFGFSDDFVSAITFRNEHEWYAGCRNGDIFRVNTATNRILDTLSTYYGYYNHDLLYEPEREVLWSNATYWKGGRWNFVDLARNEQTGEREQFRTSKLEKLHTNAAGELLGCDAKGFVIIDIEHDSMKFTTNWTSLRERTFALHTDHEQRLWVGNARGLFEFRDSALISPGIDHPAFHIRVEDIDELPDGRLVFGTKGRGVVCWKGAEVLSLSAADGLTANMIEDVYVDDRGILWVGTLNGLNKVTFDPAGRPTIRQFTVANGLPSNEIYKIRSYEGQVWLCTTKGLVQFYEQPEDTVSVVPILRGLLVNGEPVELERARVFPYQNNNLSFQFLTINFRQNGNMRYRYRLREGEAWSYTRNLSVDYASLSWGSYRFQVQSQNEDGYWSPAASYAFEIRPPWWATGWFIGLSSLLLLGSGIGLYRYRTSQLKREYHIRQQIDSLERSALQAQMNPHFIFNCLNSIQSFILHNDRKKAVEYLARFAQLVRHNLNASVRGKVSLEEELSLLDNYLALEQERFEQRFDYTLCVDEKLNPQFISFPPLLIQPYVENAIIHGLAKKTEKGEVAIHFGSENGSLAVTIRDNGPGFHPGAAKSKNGPHASVGMTITEKRLELLGANSAPAVQVAALKEGEDIKGTEVSLLIKLDRTL